MQSGSQQDEFTKRVCEPVNISAPEQNIYIHIYYGNRQQKSSICCESSTILCEESRMSDPLTHFFNRRSDVTAGRSPERSKHSLPSILSDILLPASFLALICPTALIVWINLRLFVWFVLFALFV